MPRKNRGKPEEEGGGTKTGYEDIHKIVRKRRDYDCN